ncbi:MAG: serine/threonine-protein phosphatase [Phycisphaerae bacterium]|nr:serine/threonine-protein phosphatase [Phycisphaerae bacterium]
MDVGILRWTVETLVNEGIAMQKSQLLDLSDLKVSYVDVLFVTNQESIPDSVSTRLSHEEIIWDKIDVAEFVCDGDMWRAFGTVILDTSEVNAGQHEDLWRTLKKLEQANIAVILLNDHINFPFNRFKLATTLRTASVEEIVGRVEANLTYQRSLGIGGTIVRPSVSVTNDTTEQLKMAGHVQRNFLPRRLPNLKNVRWATLFEPADWVSGDIYDIARLDEQHIGFYIADAVGHSMPAALLTMFLKQALKMRETTGNDYRIFGPLEVIRNLNQAMSDQHLAGCLFATCCYCLLNVRTLQLTYTRAGHPYGVLIRNGEATQLESRGGLLGVFEHTEFDQQTVQLEQGDKVFLYSDGCEPLVGKHGEDSEFSFSPEFTAILNLPIEKMTEAFDNIVSKRTLPPAEVDDVTVIGLEIL